jgi:hypothetical protein
MKEHNEEVAISRGIVIKGSVYCFRTGISGEVFYFYFLFIY